MEKNESPRRAFLKEVGWLLFVLNAMAAAYALLIGLKAGGIKFALVLFLWGSLLVSTGIVTLSCLNLLYSKLMDTRRSKAGKP